MIIDGQTIAAIIFVIFLTAFLWIKRKRVDFQKFLFPLLYFVMYRTNLGLRAMNSWAKRFPKMIHGLAVAGVVTGFVGMAFIAFELLRNAVKLITQPGAIPGIQPVLPIQAKGVFFVPFLYWIISIFVIAVLHEFSHGVVARRYKIPIKSSGFAFVGVLVPLIPAAFVEPDEKKLPKKPLMQQLGVFAAGPFANILTALFLALIFITLIGPVGKAWVTEAGVEVHSTDDGGGAALAGLLPSDVITQINNQTITSVSNLSTVLATTSPGDVIEVTANGTIHSVTLGAHPDNDTKSYMGIQSRQKTEVREEVHDKYGTAVVNAAFWLFGLLYWIFLLSLGIGLFNLLPLGPIDGGRMLKAVLQHWFNEQRGHFVWKWISLFFLFIILANLFAGFFV